MRAIDYVVPMVFPSDPVWKADLMRHKTWRSTQSPSSARFRSWGTERLLVQCVRKNMPFVRNIIVIVAGSSQVQPWMAEEGVKVVTHADFMPRNFLPTFNSRAMEMFLHKIPGLSETFIYGNDDMFPLSPLAADDFFRDGIPCQHHDEVAFPVRPNQFQRACMGGLNFVAADFGKSFTKTWLKGGHSLAPIRKSVCMKLWDLHGPLIEASVTRFRDDRNFNQYIYSWHQHFAGMYVDHVPTRHYAGVNLGIKSTLDIINSADCGIVCVNDNNSLASIRHFSEEVQRAISKKLSL